MTASSTKNRWATKLAAAAALLAAPPAPATEISAEWKLRYDFRYGYHLLKPADLATHRHQVSAGGKLALSKLTLVADARAYGEAAFATNSGRYGGTAVTREESGEVTLRDLYLQYKDDHVDARLGQQQVVWGEAFGFYYADIVNPKDFRDLSIDDLEAQRLPSPMLNVKFIYAKTSLQLLYIPKPFFNKLPHVGSDFAAPFTVPGLPAVPLTVNDDRHAPLALGNSELGARVTALVSGFDLSAFYLYYLDRMPTYAPTITGPPTPSVTLNPQHPRLHTFGVTATADLSTFLVRLEAIYTKDRVFAGVVSGGFVQRKSDQIVGVLGLDYTQLEKWRVGLQLSESYTLEDFSTPLYPRSLPLVSLHLNGAPIKDHTLDFTASYVLNDGSSLFQLRYWVPATDQLELGAGADLWQGGTASQLGQFKPGSRAYAMLKAYFNK